jgi:hypothetical protein
VIDRLGVERSSLGCTKEASIVGESDVWSWMTTITNG